jgi:hypothetical protein
MDANVFGSRGNCEWASWHATSLQDRVWHPSPPCQALHTMSGLAWTHLTHFLEAVSQPGPIASICVRTQGTSCVMQRRFVAWHACCGRVHMMHPSCMQQAMRHHRHKDTIALRFTCTVLADVSVAHPSAQAHALTTAAQDGATKRAVVQWKHT